MGIFGRARIFAMAGAVALGAIAVQVAPSTASGAAFAVHTAIAPSLLQQPVAVVTATDGRVFVAQLNGVIKVFHGLTDTHPKVFADLSNEVYSAQGHGLLGLTLDPKFATNHYVYVLFSRDSKTRGGPVVTSSKDTCATHATTGCVRYARLARITANGDKMVAGSEKPLIDDWCNQFVHHIGAVHFGSDGMLYVSGGDGANEQVAGSSGADYGQFGNACGDPPSPAGTNLTAPTAQGGSLRAQDILPGYDSDPVTLDGTVIRVNPSTGAGAAGNPYAASSDANERRIIAYGLRNPFRFAIQPGSSKLYVSDPGLDDYEEIDWIARPVKTVANDFGWPCWEGTDQQVYFKALNLDMCNALYSAATDTKPVFEYHDSSASVSPGDHCPEISPEGGGGAITGIGFPGTGTTYPTAFKGDVFFLDYGRQCIWASAVPPTGSATQPLLHAQFVSTLPATGITDVEPGPGGDLLLVDVANSTIYQLTYS